MKIAVVTTSRADYGIWRPVVQALSRVDGFELGWIVTGSHMQPRHGMTIEAIKNDSLAVPIWAAFECLSDGEQDALSVTLGMSQALGRMGQALSELSPDVVFVLGDRFEMCAAALACVPYDCVLAHLHGGEVTEGAMDERFRHAISKLAHLHFVSTATYAKRLIQMGEEPWRVFYVGAPALDAILESVQVGQARARDEASQWLVERGITRPFLLSTYHPETQDLEGSMIALDEMLEVIERSDLDVLFTAPNADMAGDRVRRRLERFVGSRPGRRLVESVGVPRYYHVMAQAQAMIGNSSSGILEAASLGLPVVNIGQRQAGRVRGKNVVDVCGDRSQIAEGLAWALGAGREVAAALRLQNPYGDGMASRRIASVMRWALDNPGLLKKRFVDIESADVDDIDILDIESGLAQERVYED